MTVSNLIAAFIAYGLDASKPGSPSVGTNASYYYATDTGKLYCWTGSGWTAVSGGGTGAANPSATAGPTAVNGSATTFMRSDGAPAVQLGSNSQKGLVQVDGTTITASSGIISATPATLANPTATASDTAVNGVATTYMRSDAAPAVQKASSSVFGLAKVDNTTITAAGGVISASASGIGVPNGANPTATASNTAVNGVATTYMRSDAAPAIQKGSNVQFGVCEGDGATVQVVAGVISTIPAGITSAADADIDQIFFGAGTDGTVVINSGTTNLARDMYYQSLTLSGTGKLNTNGWRVYISGTLDLTNAPAGAIVSISSLGTSLNGGPGSGIGGAGGAGGGTISVTNTVGTGVGGGTGGNGGTGAGTQAGAIGASGNQIPNTAGAGGKGGSVGGTAGGIARAGATGSFAVSDVRRLTDQLYVMQSTTAQYVKNGPGAPGGSSGAGDGVGTGGGGGGGGATPGVIWISARTIARATATTVAKAVNVDGGAGGNGAVGVSGTNRGGGGGGGGAPGGWLYIIYRSLTGTAATNVFSATGGNGGNAANGTGTGTGGDGGSSGSKGRIDVYCLADGSWTHAEADTTTVAGTAGSGSTGGSGGTANAQVLTL